MSCVGSDLGFLIHIRKTIWKEHSNDYSCKVQAHLLFLQIFYFTFPHHAHSVLLWWQYWISQWQNRQLCWVQMKRLQHVDKGILNKFILKASVFTTFYFTQRAIKSNGNILFVNEIWTAVSKIQLYMSLYLNNMLIGVCILLFMHRLCSIQFSFWVNNILFMFQFKTVSCNGDHLQFLINSKNIHLAEDYPRNIPAK